MFVSAISLKGVEIYDYEFCLISNNFSDNPSRSNRSEVRLRK